LLILSLLLFIVMKFALLLSIRFIFLYDLKESWILWQLQGLIFQEWPTLTCLRIRRISVSYSFPLVSPVFFILLLLLFLLNYVILFLLRSFLLGVFLISLWGECTFLLGGEWLIFDKERLLVWGSHNLINLVLHQILPVIFLWIRFVLLVRP